MNEKNLAAIRAAALALVRQAELAGVVVTIETVPAKPLAMGCYGLQVGVRVARNPRVAGAVLASPDQAAPGSLVAHQLQMTDDLLEILGRPNFKCAHMADALRTGGQKIPHRSENEQAAAILFLLNHYLADQVNWWTNARAALHAMATGGAA